MGVKLLAGRYELLEKIGDGGMAIVYKARCRLLNRFVAIKILKPEYVKDPKIIDNFRKESQAAAGLNHPNIVNIYDVGKEGNVHYIVMELIEGRTLAELIAEEGPMDYRKVIDFTRQIAAGLSYAHKNNIIHRDIKPHNILVTPEGVAKIADFGIAKAINESTIAKPDGEDRIMGSVHYFSPEQARGGYVDLKTDIYSLGIVMYEMLTARVPFDGDTPVQVAIMHMNEPMLPPSHFVKGIPPRLESIIMKCTDKVSVNRYASADDLIKELDDILKLTRIVGEAAIDPQTVKIEEPEKKEEKAREERTRTQNKSQGKNKKKIIAIAVAVLVALVLGIVFLGGSSEVKVPDVTGMTYEEAEDALAEKGLKIEKGNEVFSDEFESGQIVSQSPKADMKVKKGKVIRVNLSKGAGTEIVPSVLGMTEDEARAVLEGKGFSLGSIDYAESTSEAGTVISQDPGAGVEVTGAQKVNIVIAKEIEKKVGKVPGLLGKSLEDAKAAIQAAGFVVGDITYGYSDDYPEGQVIWQEKSSGTELEEGSYIGIKVSKGTEAVEPEPVEPEPEPEPEDEIDDSGEYQTE